MISFFRTFLLSACLWISIVAALQSMPLLKVAENPHYFATTDGEPFFWLADTGWLLLKELDRESTLEYLDVRQQQGFNVIQVMLLHSLETPVNPYGQQAIVGNDPGSPITTPGARWGSGNEYDFWDHVDFVLEEAANRGIYIALVPLWGSNIEAFHITPEQAFRYGEFLGQRLGQHDNILWLNGGDIDGSKNMAVWDSLAEGILSKDRRHLMSFHPRGRMMSSMWFHDRKWLDFNMVQSGHRRYDQDDTDLCFGEDNWRYIAMDWHRLPVKPTLDGEPSYEGIPQGLHDVAQPLWDEADVRRYAYWSVFAGAAGFTYGNNSVMQFYDPEKTKNAGAYGATRNWRDAIQDPGAKQMKHLFSILKSCGMLEREPAQNIFTSNTGLQHRHLVACRSENRVMVYAYCGQTFGVKMDLLGCSFYSASWLCPRDGSRVEVGEIRSKGAIIFDPPGDASEGNDWVLFLEPTQSKD